MDKRTAGVLALMLNGFPQSPNTDPAATMAGLGMALDGIRDDAIREGCARFMRGQVHGHDIRFAPSIPQIVKECEERQQYIELRERDAARPKLPPPTTTPAMFISPEDREKMKPRIKELYHGFKVQMMPAWEEPKEERIAPDDAERLCALMDKDTGGEREEVAGSA